MRKIAFLIFVIIQIMFIYYNILIFIISMICIIPLFVETFNNYINDYDIKKFIKFNTNYKIDFYISYLNFPKLFIISIEANNYTNLYVSIYNNFYTINGALKWVSKIESNDYITYLLYKDKDNIADKNILKIVKKYKRLNKLNRLTL